MSDPYRYAGNLLFHYRNVVFPLTLGILLSIWPPVAIGYSLSNYWLLMGVLFIVMGLTIRILTIGLAYIIRGGRNRKIYAEDLVTEGIFAHSRNPMYVGNILLGIGFLCIAGNLTGIVIGSGLVLLTYRLIVHSEESYLREQFTDSYDKYCDDVPRWLPKVGGLKDTIVDYEYRFDWSGVLVKEYNTLFLYLFIPLLLIIWKLYLAGILAEYGVIVTSLAVILIIFYVTVRFLKKTRRLMSIKDPDYQK